MGYANHIRRLIAFVIDTLIVWAFYSSVSFILHKSIGNNPTVNAIEIILAFSVFFYGVLFESSNWQATPGKRITGLKVTTLNGDKISFGKALLRALGKIVDTITYGIGFAMVLWTKKRQGLHDKIASTVTVSAETDSSFFETQGDVFIQTNIDGKVAELKNLHNSGILNREEYELALKKLKVT